MTERKKAQAPRPKKGGYEAAAEADAAAQQILTITITREVTVGKHGRVLPESHTLAVGIMPMRERIICRKATGLPFEAYWSTADAIAIDSVMVLWWLARRANGEATLTFDAAAAEWPADLLPEEIDVDVNEPDPEADDPEA